MVRYLRRHHVALLALFLALGAGGAVAATSSTGGQVRGFSVVSANQNSKVHGRLVSLAGLTLKWKSASAPDQRDCILTATAAAPAEAGGFVATHSTGGAGNSYSVTGKSIRRGGSIEVARASFLPGAPDVVQQVEGQLTFHASSSRDVISAQYHLAGEKRRCLFQGDITAGH